MVVIIRPSFYMDKFRYNERKDSDITVYIESLYEGIRLEMVSLL